MKVTAINTPPTGVPNAKHLSRKAVSAYKVIREQVRAITAETPHVPDYREQNLLDSNIGPEIRRIWW